MGYNATGFELYIWIFHRYYFHIIFFSNWWGVYNVVLVFYFEKIGIVIEKQCDALFKSYPTPFSNQKMVAGSLSTGDEQRLPALVKNPGYD